MLKIVILTFWLDLVFSQMMIVSDALHHTMGPKFAITYEEIESHPCTFF